LRVELSPAEVSAAIRTFTALNPVPSRETTS
jgi:hypothetical protein